MFQALLPYIPTILASAQALNQGRQEMNMAPPPPQEPEVYGYVTSPHSRPAIHDPNPHALNSWKAQMEQRKHGQQMLGGGLSALGQMWPQLSGAFGGGGEGFGQSQGYGFLGGSGSTADWRYNDPTFASMMGGFQ